MTSASNRLWRPLGIWQHNGPLHQKWTYLVDLPSNLLFQRLQGAGTFLQFLPAHSPRVFHSNAINTSFCPSSSVPVTVAHQTSHFIELTASPVHSHRYIHPQAGTPSSCLSTPLSMSGYLKNLPKDLCYTCLDTLWCTDQNLCIWTWSYTWGWATPHITTG
jgi:hypothetical protein